ncbi:DUF58 domain-containing protein [Subtercola frigoramans]|uniref:Uncharacterized protein (DUF58 family) n=1 Tax=Subtercola frigoramans TaxID=120298 RepID=A0ABS2L841_9MICO|nr:DUF58 domain-containing protein [Subtercola frigoramans]MBM7473265.1 uncharacterized protein (DUF58 family) [Subtercola frigoramans]
MAISGRFVLLLALGVLPIVVLGQAYGLAAEGLVGWLLLTTLLGVVDLALAGSPRQLTAERLLPQRVRLGESVTGELYLTNTGRRMLRGTVRDAWQPSAGAATTRSALVIPRGERRLVSIELRPFRRGERRVEFTSIRSFGPLGLWARQATLRVPGRIRVLPPFTSRKHLPSRLARLRELDGRTSLMIRGQGTEFDSLREYVRGDDVRSIDWRATARRDEVVVRTWRPERDRRVVIVIDTGRTSAARIDNEPRLDTAFESALLLAALATRAGDRVDVLAYDRRTRARVQGAVGPELLSRMVDALATVDPELLEMDWSAIPARVREITNQRALVVLLTSAETPGSSQGLLAVLPQLTQRHTVLVASVSDPETFARTARLGSRDEVYTAAAAERALLDVARVSAALRQQGADVVTGSPADLPPAVADRYLALKAAGRL